MILTPVILEIILLSLGVCGVIFLRMQSSLLVWSNAVVFSGQTFFPVFFVILSLYYSNLYDLRIVRSFSEFMKKLPHAFGITFVLLYGFYTLFPLMGVKGRPFFSSL